MKHLLIVTLISLGLQVFSQELKESPTKHQIGLQAGFTTGSGISYKYFPKETGLQITASPVFSPSSHNINIGVALLKKFKETNDMMVYGYLANRWKSKKTVEYDYDYYSGNSFTYTRIRENYSAGFGIGLELSVANFIALNGQAGYAGHNLISNVSGQDYIFTFTGELGLFFKL